MREVEVAPVEPLLAHVAYTYTLEAGGYAMFGMLYFATDLVASLHSFRLPLYLEAELAIPFVPAMAAVYASLYLMFLIVPFVLRTRREVVALYWTVFAEVAIAGACFLVLPVEPVFPPIPDAGMFRSVYEATDEINLTYNLFPSIHVAFAASAAMVLANRGVRGMVFGIWAALICASTLFTYQHHVADVAGGLVLAIVCVRRFYVRPLTSGHDRLVTTT